MSVRVHFTPNLRRHLIVETSVVDARTVREALDAVFARNPTLGSYVVDDQGRLRTHVVVYLDGARVHDRVGLGDKLGEDAEIHVMQALSGG